ncbi:MAG: serine/threonine protein kinase [Verrucomicrobia bacterium]|nr:serine/threonine protein kinase [Verrucomicrobiota bacterium]
MKLGEGGMGVIFLARHKEQGRYCAIKVISSRFSSDEDAHDRFLREARAAAALSHPNLVRVFDSDQFEGRYFMAMEYVEGLTVADIIRDRGAIPIPLAFYWLKQAATALEYIHGKGVIHRDIKPDNMIVDADGRLKIMDLGLAKVRLEPGESLTVTGAMMGSAHYMSPEQINDSKSVDARTDLYSLGVTFYQMIVGDVPFYNYSAAAVYVAQLQESIPSVALPDPAITRELDRLIAKMTAKERDVRFSSAGALIVAIRPRTPDDLPGESERRFLAGIGFEHRKVENLLKERAARREKVHLDHQKEKDGAADRAASAHPTAPPVPPAARRERSSLRMAVLFCLFLALAYVGYLWIGWGLPQFAPVHPPSASEKPSEMEDQPLPKRPQGVQVSIQTVPDKATVMFDADAAESPLICEDVAPGRHNLKVSLRGYETENRVVEIKEGRPEQLRVVLKRAPSNQMNVTVQSNPPGADLFIKGVFFGKTPQTVPIENDDESVECVLRLKDHREKKITLMPRNGESQTFQLEPLPRSGNRDSDSSRALQPRSSGTMTDLPH